MKKTSVIVLLLLIIMISWSYVYFMGPNVVQSGKAISLLIASEGTTKRLEVLKKTFEEASPETKRNLETYFNYVIHKESSAPFDKIERSVQDHTFNIYASYSVASVTLDELPEYSEEILWFIPKYRRYWYAFLYKKDQKHLLEYIEALLQAYENKNIDIIEVAEEVSTLFYSPYVKKEFVDWLSVFIKSEIQQSHTTDLTLKQYVCYLFYENKEFSEWDNLSVVIAEIRAAQVKEHVQKLRLLLRFIPYLIKNKVEISAEERKALLKLCYESMVRLEPDGSFPMLYAQKDRENQREFMYYAAEFFDRDDMRYISYGGWKNANALPPLQKDFVIKRTQTYILRNSWNILDVLNHRVEYSKENRILGNDSFQITYENHLNSLSIYSQNYPRLVFQFHGDIQKVLSYDFNEKMGVIETDRMIVKINKLKDVVEIDFKEEISFDIKVYKGSVQLEDGVALVAARQFGGVVAGAENLLTRYKVRNDLQIDFSNVKGVRKEAVKESLVYSTQIICTSQKKVSITLNIETPY